MIGDVMGMRGSPWVMGDDMVDVGPVFSWTEMHVL